MAWDASRPVPWQRLVREWLIYVGLMAAVFLVFFRDGSLVGLFAGLLASGPLYLLIGYALAKLGYQRKTLQQARTSTSRKGSASTQHAAAPPRPRPAPTRRTGGTGTRPAGKRRR